jgi:thioredoxin
MMVDSELEAIRKRKMMEIMNAQASIPVPDEVVEIESVDAFNQLVNDHKDSLILVDCWAPWCGPCRAFAPIFKKLQKTYHPKNVVFTKLNTDNHQAIAQQFNITGIPTTLFIHNNKLVHRAVGMQNQAQFSATIDQVLKKMEE